MPATAQAPPKRQQQPTPTEATLIAAIIAALGAAVTVAGVTAALGTLLASAGIGSLALRAVATLMLSWPHEVMEGTGPAQRWAIRANLLRRAQFMLAACRRVQAAIVAARSRDDPVLPAIQDALTAERGYMSQHIAASGQRVTAATRVDGMASTYGNVLGWQAVKDSKCTPGCRRASGRNFRADRPPMIEGHPSLPGAVHGSTCRCLPVPPFKDAPVMP